MLSFGNNILSQPDFRRGYIIKNCGDTLWGLVNFTGNPGCSKRCLFKADPLSEPDEYFPEQIKAYGIENAKLYVSKQIKSAKGVKNVFLECLVAGKISLFYLQGEDGEMFYIEKDTLLSELSNAEIREERGGSTFSRKSNYYKGMLKYYMKDCPEMTTKILSADYDKKSLIDLSLDYQQRMCKREQCVVYEKQIPKAQLFFGVDGGYGIQSLHYYFAGEDNIFFHLQSDYYAFGEILGRVTLDEKQKAFFQLNMGFSTAKFKGSNLYNESASAYQDIDYRYDCFISGVQLGYRMLNSKLKPYVTAGIPFQIILTEDGTCTTHKYTYKFNNKGAYLPGKNNDPEKMLIGAQVGLGIEYPFKNRKTVYLLLNYERLRTFTSFSFSSGNIRAGIYF
jgi:hypothetical protein